MMIFSKRLMLLMLGCTAMFSCRTTRSAMVDPATETNIVFEPDAQYASMRIPALVMTKKQSLLAFCEARIGTASDWADMNLVMRRSTDGGKSWSAIHVLDSFRGGPVGNPTPIVDDKGKVHLLFQKDYKEVYYTNSEDDGVTWATPVNITQAVGQFSSTYNWNVVAPGPGHSIQLSNGRLLAPVWMVNTKRIIPRRAHSPSCVGTIYSDDYGKTWQRGTIVADSTGFIPNPNESMPVQLADGSVLLSMRNASTIKQRAFSTSPDGISAWTPARYAEELYDPTCMASIVRLTNWKPNGKPALVFLNPDSRNIEKHPRANLTASISFDDGNTWQLHKVVNSGPSGYSDMAVGSDNTVYCLYETNTQQHKGFTYSLVLKKFNAQWLQQKSK